MRLHPFLHCSKRGTMVFFQRLVRVAVFCVAVASGFNLPLSSISGIAVHPVPLRRHNDPDAASVYSLAASNIQDVRGNFLATQVWPSARTAALALERHLLVPAETVVCEFGCGPGLPSLTAASLGACHVYATDLDEFALELVEKAAEQQGLLESLTTRKFDLIHSYTDEIPYADLYLMSDVFECNAVAEGAAKITAEILERGTATVWVFAQSDRAQREMYLKELQKLVQDPTLCWRPNKLANDGLKGSLQFHKRLWLCDIDETSVCYG